MAEEKLKVTDLVDYSETDYREIGELWKTMAGLSHEYRTQEDTNDLEALEKIKREYLGHMERYVVLYSRVKKFKGVGHTYLEDARKEIKAQAIKILMDRDGIKATPAENIVPDFDYYKKRVLLMENLKEFFIRVELMHDIYNSTFSAIKQSISVAVKERENSRMGG